MATIGSRFLDLIDVFKRSNETMQIATIIELLAETNAVMDDALAVEANMGTKHRTTIRTGLPTVTWGMLYKGIQPSKGRTAQVDDATGFAEALSSVDERLLEIAKDAAALRLSEAKGFLEAMNQEIASTIFYGNVATDPEKFTGLANRFNDLTAPNGNQIVDGGGNTPGANTSLWIVYWGDNQTHLIYPQGTKAGLDRQDKGSQRVLDSDNNPYYVKEELFRWHIGLVVRDWRFVSRIANIDVADLAAGTVDIYALLRKAFWKIHSHRVAGGRGAIYANADVLEALDAATTPTSSTTPIGAVRLRRDEVEGKEVLSYRGIPIRQVDALLNTEDVVV